MQALSPGKVRGLQACATPHGIFTILAIDHRDSLRALIAPENPHTITPGQLTELKLTIIRHLAGRTSAVLLDPLFSAGQAIAGGQLPGSVGLLVALEEQGYLGNPYQRRTPLLAGWSVEKARRLGANGIKILLFYHPGAGAAAEAQENLVRSIAADCRRYELPFFLEPISYPLDPQAKKNSPEFAASRRQVVVDTVRRLSPLGADVMKVEFPVDTAYEPDRAAWADACAELNEACRTPWTLLSAGDSFDVFKDQVRVAGQAGCSGFVGGRAIWQEAATMPGRDQASFLANVAARRLAELQAVALEYAQPWFARCALPAVDERWYQQY